MIYLVLLAIILVALTVWMLVRGITHPVVEDEVRAQLAQYVLQRDRLINELDRVETGKQADDIESAAADSEIARLELELADVLKLIDKAGEQQGTITAAPRHISFITTAFLALSLPLVAGIAYISVQGEELLWLAGFNKRGGDSMPMNHPVVPQQAKSVPAEAVADDKQQFPPQVMEMVARLEKRLMENPKDGEGWKRLGRSYMVLGRNRDAVGAYSQAAELLPDDKDVRLALQQLAALASADKHQGQAKEDNQVAHPPMPEGSLEAIIGLEKAIAAEPENAIAWAELAYGYEGIGRVEDSQRAWAKAHELAPENIDILAAYAGSVFTNDPRDPQGSALALYKKLYKLSPKHPDGLWFLGLAAYSEGNIARTREMWRELLTVLPPQSEAYASVSDALAGVERLLNTPK